MPARGIGMELSELLQWWNLIFELPFVGAVVYILALGFSGVDHGVDGHGDAATHLEHDADHAPDADHDAAGHDNPVSLGRALEFLGIGKVPLSIVAPTFWIIWSFAGFASNTILITLIEAQRAYVLVSIAIAAIVGVAITGNIATAFARFIPRTQTYGVETEDLVGSLGVAGYPGITHRFGEAHVYDANKNQHIVACRMRQEDASIKTGDTLLLIEYDRKNRVFLVEPYADTV